MLRNEARVLVDRCIFCSGLVQTMDNSLFARVVMEKAPSLCGQPVMEGGKETPVLRMVTHPVSIPLASALLPVMGHRLPTMSSVLVKWQWFL